MHRLTLKLPGTAEIGNWGINKGSKRIGLQCENVANKKILSQLVVDKNRGAAGSRGAAEKDTLKRQSEDALWGIIKGGDQSEDALWGIITGVGIITGGWTRSSSSRGRTVPEGSFVVAVGACLKTTRPESRSFWSSG